MDLKILKELNQPIFYVTNEVGNGIGLETVLPNYHIVCLDDHPLVDILVKSGASVFCLEKVLGTKNVLFRNSGLILDQPAVLSFIKEKSKGEQPWILFFKPQRKIEIVAQKNNFNLIGNQVRLNRLFEDKLSFFGTSKKSNIKVPKGEILKFSEGKFVDLAKKYGEKLVIQFGRGWAGNSTFFVSNEKEFKNLQLKFGRLTVKVNEFIKGKTVLNNAVIFRDRVFVSEPALQIKSDEVLTSTQAGTGGRRWPSGLGQKEKEEINKMTVQVGRLMERQGYRGFFGLDFLIDESTNEILLSENNARLTASVPFYTKLELGAGAFPLLGFHLLAFISQGKTEESDFTPPQICGSEIVARNTQNVPVRILGSVKTGLYHKNFEFERESAFLQAEQEDDFWLETVSEGRIVNPEIEIARIDTLASVCDKDGSLKQEYKKILERIKKDLILSNV